MPFFQVCGRIRTNRAKTGCGTRLRTTSAGSVLAWKIWTAKANRGQAKKVGYHQEEMCCNLAVLSYFSFSVRHTHSCLNTHPQCTVSLGFTHTHTHSGRPDKAETTQTRIQCHQPSCRCVLGSKVQHREAGKAHRRMRFPQTHTHTLSTSIDFHTPLHWWS